MAVFYKFAPIHGGTAVVNVRCGHRNVFGFYIGMSRDSFFCVVRNLFGYEIRFDCYHCDLFAVAALDDYRFGINLILYIRGKPLVEISGHTVIQRRGDVTFKKRTLKHNIFLFFCPLRRSVPPQRSEIAVISVYALPKNLSMFTTFSFSAA